METKDPALTKTRMTDPDSQHSNEYDTLAGKDIDATVDNANVVKGTQTFQETVIDSEHVNDNDNLARQPDRRDQQGSAFDDGINEHNTGSKNPKSEELTTLNRYANIDNAQTRILSPDEKD